MPSFFEILLYTAILAVVGYVVFAGARSGYLLRIASELEEGARPYAREEGVRSMLVIGDSTAVGVGASPEKSVAGRFAKEIDARTFHEGRSGATTKDILSQIRMHEGERFDVVLVQVGANDVIRFRDLDDSAKNLEDALEKLNQMSERVVLLTAGDIGDAPIFPWPLSLVYTKRTEMLRSRFITQAETHDALYIDLYSLPDPFSEEPEKYFAKDRLHLSDEGYGVWYEALKERVNERWPEIYGSEQ